METANKTRQTVKEVAESLGVKQQHVLAWIRTGELSAVDVSLNAGAGRPRWRITAEAIAAFELRRSAGDAPVERPAPPRSSGRRRAGRVYV